MKFILLLLLVACTTLRDDRNPPSIKSNFYNGELSVNGNISGIHNLVVTTSSKPEDYNISFYPPLDGSLFISSERCNINHNVRVIGKELFEFNLKEFISQFISSCAIVLSYSPEINPDEVRTQINPNYMTRINIVSVSDHDLIGNTVLQYKEGSSVPLLFDNLPFPSELGLSDCKTGFSTRPITSSRLILKTDDLTLEPCAVRVGIKYQGRVKLFIVFLNPYKAEFIKLPNPSISDSGKKVEVVAPNEAFLMDIDGKSYYKKSVSLKSVKVIRLYSLAGRNVYCEYKNKLLSCKE